MCLEYNFCNVTCGELHAKCRNSGKSHVIFQLRKVGAGTNKIYFSQIYIDVIGNFMSMRSDINFLTFSSIYNSETKGYVCIVLAGKFSLIKISVTHRLVCQERQVKLVQCPMYETDIVNENH